MGKNKMNDKLIIVGKTTTGEELKTFPESKEGYQAAVTYIDGLEDCEKGIYYLDAPEWVVDNEV